MFVFTLVCVSARISCGTRPASFSGTKAKHRAERERESADEAGGSIALEGGQQLRNPRPHRAVLV